MRGRVAPCPCAGSGQGWIPRGAFAWDRRAPARHDITRHAQPVPRRGRSLSVLCPCLLVKCQLQGLTPMPSCKALRRQPYHLMSLSGNVLRWSDPMVPHGRIAGPAPGAAEVLQEHLIGILIPRAGGRGGQQSESCNNVPDPSGHLSMQAGVICLSVAYLADDSSTNLRVSALSPAIQFGVTAVHFRPFHCCTLTIPEPS